VTVSDLLRDVACTIPPLKGEGGRPQDGRVGWGRRAHDPTRLLASLRSLGATLPLQGRDGAGRAAAYNRLLCMI